MQPSLHDPPCLSILQQVPGSVVTARPPEGAPAASFAHLRARRARPQLCSRQTLQSSNTMSARLLALGCAASASEKTPGACRGGPWGGAPAAVDLRCRGTPAAGSPAADTACSTASQRPCYHYRLQRALPTTSSTTRCHPLAPAFALAEEFQQGGGAPSPLPAPAPLPEVGSSSSRRSFASFACSARSLLGGGLTGALAEHPRTHGSRRSRSKRGSNQ